MTIPDPTANLPPQKPFLLTLQRLEETLSGNFRPGALIQITPALRTSGLLFDLPGEELRSLLLVLTFAHPNGHIQPTLLELARALRQSEGKTRARMQHLEHFLWKGRPLLHELRRESGLHAYAPSMRILGTEQALPGKQILRPPRQPAYRPAGREAVIAHSRAMYTRPREEVEKEIARLNGWPWPFRSIAETQEMMRQQALALANAPPKHPISHPNVSESSTSLTFTPMSTNLTDEQAISLHLQLQALGVPSEEADSLLARFDPDRIQRQIAWLPFRKANRPARLLVAAIEEDYEVPLALQQLQEQPQDNPVSQSPAEMEQVPDASPSSDSATDLTLP